MESLNFNFYGMILLFGFCIMVSWYAAISTIEKDYRSPLMKFAMVLIISIAICGLYYYNSIFNDITIKCYLSQNCKVQKNPFINEVIENYEMEQAKKQVQNKLRN